MSAQLQTSAVPRYAGFDEVTARGIVSTLHPDNTKVASRVQGAEPLPAWLFDPQTSDGLLVEIAPAAAPAVLQQLHDAGFIAAAVIGTVSPKIRASRRFRRFSSQWPSPGGP